MHTGVMESIALSHVTIHGHDVRYRRAGEGEAVLLIHGLAGSSLTWQHVMGPLAEHYDVIAPDLLGHGESAKPMGDYSLGAMASGLRNSQYQRATRCPSRRAVPFRPSRGGVSCACKLARTRCASRPSGCNVA